MSITALITGRLVADPARSTGPKGRPCTTALVAAATDPGDDLVSLIAFGRGAEQLAALAKGDSVSVTGKARVTTWTGKGGESRAGLSVTVHALLTAYHVRRNEQAMDADADATEPDDFKVST